MLKKSTEVTANENTASSSKARYTFKALYTFKAQELVEETGNQTKGQGNDVFSAEGDDGSTKRILDGSTGTRRRAVSWSQRSSVKVEGTDWQLLQAFVGYLQRHLGKKHREHYDLFPMIVIPPSRE
jgi:hypothetical protein